MRWINGAFALLAAATSLAAQPVMLKPPLVGLISMGQAGERANNDNARFGAIPGSSLHDLADRRNAFDGVVVNIPWVRIQPDGPQAWRTAPIDDALAQIRQYNHDPATTRPLRAMLRIWAGGNAPDWAKALDGGPITVFDGQPNKRGRPQVLGRFWAAGYGQAFRALQDRLAARYDAEPLIAQVADTSCTSRDDEWNAIPIYGDRVTNVSSIQALKAAGYSDAAFLQCMRRGFEDYARWRTTRINLTLGPIFRIDDVGDFQRPLRDAAATIDLLQAFRARFGAAAVLSNHNLSYPLLRANLEVYRAIRLAGGPIEFQTHSPRGLDWPNTIRQAACLGADAVELWNSTEAGGYVDYPTATLVQWSDVLRQRDARARCPDGTLP